MSADPLGEARRFLAQGNIEAARAFAAIATVEELRRLNETLADLDGMIERGVWNGIVGATPNK